MGSRGRRNRSLRVEVVAGTTLLLASAVLGFSGGFSGCQPPRTLQPPSRPTIQLSPRDRILVLVPHPDDEVLGCGGIIQDAVAMGLPVRVVFFTYGDNNQWSFLVYRKYPVLRPAAVRRMGLLRGEEALAAAHVLGLRPTDLIFLGYPDFGTLHIWKSHWGDRPPFQSMLTRVTAVPYPTALSPGAPYTGEAVVHDLTTVLREFRPTKLFVSHPADHMPDHAALYLFTRVALWDLEREIRPEVYPYLIHFKQWPLPKGYAPDRPLDPPARLASHVGWSTYPLTSQANTRNVAALKGHRTQYRSNARDLLTFFRSNELFGDFPVVPLGREASSERLAAGTPVASSEVPEELNEVERAKFVGIETRTVQLEGDTLVISIGFSRPLGQAVEASVYVFGYRADRPFGQMPKLHIKAGALLAGVYDRDQLLPARTVEISHRATHLTIRIPLAVLGHPQRILTSARTFLGELPLDWVSWRVLVIQ